MMAHPPHIAKAPAPAKDPPDDGRQLTLIAPRYVWVIRASLAINALFFLVLAAAGDIFLSPAIGAPGGILTLGMLALIAPLMILLPSRRVASIAYHISDDHLRIRRGFLFRVDTIVPFVRVQHLDVSQGPVERALGLSRLIVHTSGVLNQAVVLPGLESDLAAAMREAIHRRIRTDFE